jgi:hypothetical protein
MARTPKRVPPEPIVFLISQCKHPTLGLIRRTLGPPFGYNTGWLTNETCGLQAPIAFSEALAERIRQALARRKNVEEKKMFGAIGFLLNANMLVGVWKESLIVRLGPEEGDEALKEPHVSEFNITGRSMQGWVLVGPEGLKNDSFKRWILWVFDVGV